MKIYTKTGDGGQTSLFSGERVDKFSPEVAAYGDVDELNAVLGLAQSHCRSLDVQKDLNRIQADLFLVGGDLATRKGKEQHAARRPVEITAARTRVLEQTIDRYQASLPELRNFILPGGTAAGAALHLARTVCRRAERRVARLVRDGVCRPDVLVYLNRLSDLLFVLARAENHRAGFTETIWKFED